MLRKCKDFNSGVTKDVELNTRGLAVKIQDCVIDGFNYHNHWCVILGMYSETEYRVAVRIDVGLVNVIAITEANIKMIVGDLESDFCNIGKVRHLEEVRPFIQGLINL
jgi:hypothetical protein